MVWRITSHSQCRTINISVKSSVTCELCHMVSMIKVDVSYVSKIIPSLSLIAQQSFVYAQ